MKKEFNNKSNKSGGNKHFNKNRKPNSKNKGKDFTKELPDEIKKDPNATNDPSWYNKNATLLNNVASVPYAWATGLPLNPTIDGGYLPYAIPGMCALVVDTNPLSIEGPGDPVNVAARLITAQIRSKNSGAKNYDPNDLMIRLLAEGEIIAWITFATRVYATACLYSASNRYLPDTLLTMQSIDTKDIQSNLNDFRSRLNQIIAKARAIMYIPKGMDLYARWSWLFANYYIDSETAKDQVYFMCPSGYRKFEIGEVQHSGQLTYVPWDVNVRGGASTLHTWVELCDALDDMLDPIYEDQDMCIMAGDMEKYFGPSAMTISDIPESYTAQFVVDHVVLDQFRNAQSEPNVAINDMNVFNTNRNIVQDPAVYYLMGGTRYDEIPTRYSLSTHVYNGDDLAEAIYSAYHEDLFVDTPISNPTPDDTMENTRLSLMTTGKVVTEQGTYYQATSGSERVVGFIMARNIKNAQTGKPILAMTSHKSLILTYNTDATYNVLHNMSTYHYLSVMHDDEFDSFILATKAFDYYPRFKRCWVNVTVEQGEDYDRILQTYKYGTNTRVTNFALIPFNMLQKMNDVAFLSEIGIY